MHVACMDISHTGNGVRHMRQSIYESEIRVTSECRREFREMNPRNSMDRTTWSLESQSLKPGVF